MAMPMGFKFLRRNMFVALVATLLLTSSCMQVRPWRTQDRPWQPETVSNANRVRVTQLDGTVVVLKQASLHTTERELHGVAVGEASAGSLIFPIDGLASLETSQLEGGRVAGNMVLGVSYTFVIIVVAILLATPVVLAG